MKLRHLLVLASTLLLAGVVLAVVMTLTRELESQADREVRASLASAGQALESRYGLQASLTEAQTAVVVAEPRLKAVVAARDVDAATLHDVAAELQRALGADLFLLTNAEAVILADTADENAAGFTLGDRPVVVRALRDGRASATWVDDERVFQVHARRLQFGDTVVGLLVVGFALDQNFVDAIAGGSGAGVALRLQGKVIASADVEPDLAHGILASDRPNDVETSDGRYLAMAVAIPGYAGERAVDALLVRSLDEALAPSRALIRWVYFVGAIAWGLGIAGSLVAAGRVSRPVEELERVAARVREGDQEVRARQVGSRELAHLALSFNQMLDELYEARDAQLAKQRLEDELAIATRIQTSIVPRDPQVPGLRITGTMRPASEVGGDYYDVQPAEDGCWIAIGDVAGHGLSAGLVMVMLQSALAVLMRALENSPPSRLVSQVNDMMIDTVHDRMQQWEHATLAVIRYHRDGRFEFAGAHEEFYVLRAATGEVESLETPGTWLGLQRGIEEFCPVTSGRLEPGDVLMLFTDGITEANNPDGEQFGSDRLRNLLGGSDEAVAPAEICQRAFDLLDAWQEVQDDDQTLVVIERVADS